jgi:hypothetical protein
LVPTTSRRGRREIEHATEGIGTVERGAGPAHHLDAAHVLERKGKCVPLLRSDECNGQIAAVLQHEDAPREGGVEAARVHVEVLHVALDYVDARQTPEGQRYLAGG